MGPSSFLGRVAAPPRALAPERRERLFTLIEEVLRERLGEAAAEVLLVRLGEHLQRASDHMYDGVNPHRDDVAPTWDRARSAVFGEMVNVGAVHLELGTWTAFPDSRIAETIQADGLGEFIRLDVDASFHPDVVADVTALPFRSGSVDRVASNSLVEHVAYPHRVLEETYRVLRPGGVMVIVMPFVWMLHGYPNDYVRLTPQFFERICRQVGFEQVTIDVNSSGGLYNVLHNTAKMAAISEARGQEEALRELHELVIVLLATLIPLDTGFEGALDHWFHSVRCFARKPGTYMPSERQHEPRRPFVERALDLLADPAFAAPLGLAGKRLICRDYGIAYEVRAGVPIFTEPRALSRSRHRLTAGRDQLDGWVRQQLPAQSRRRLPRWLRKAGIRALRG